MENKELLDKYDSEIFPFGLANLPSTLWVVCPQCDPPHNGVKNIEEILEDGTCISCGKKKSVYNPFFSRQVIAKYGYGKEEYFYIKELFKEQKRNLT